MQHLGAICKCDNDSFTLQEIQNAWMQWIVLILSGLTLLIEHNLHDVSFCIGFIKLGCMVF